MTMFKKLFDKDDKSVQEKSSGPIIKDLSILPYHEDHIGKPCVMIDSEIKIFNKHKARRLMTLESRITKEYYDEYDPLRNVNSISRRLYCKCRRVFWETKSGVIVCETSGSDNTTYDIMQKNDFLRVFVTNIVNDESNYPFWSSLGNGYQCIVVSDVVFNRDVPDLEYLNSMISEL